MTHGSARPNQSAPGLDCSDFQAAAPAALVNRTHRVVRERARSIQQRRTLFRSLWIPLTVSFGMLALLLCSLYSLLDESEFFPGGLPDSAQQMLFVTMWCVPFSAAVLAVVWFRRSNARTGSRSPQ